MPLLRKIIRKIYDQINKFQIGDHFRISTYKNVFGYGYNQSWSEEVFVIKMFMLLVILMVKTLLEPFTKGTTKKKKRKKKNFRI